MSRHPQPRGERGSLRWIQEFVNDRPGVLDSAIVSASGQRIKGPIQWRSPLADDDYAEYRDDAFLEKLGIELEARPLAEFWPRRGAPVGCAGARRVGGVRARRGEGPHPGNHLVPNRG